LEALEMNWSLGEVRALAMQAAQGACLSWDAVEAAGYSVHWLQRAGLPGIGALANYLVYLEKNSGQYDKTRCPLEGGVALSDTHSAEGDLGVFRQPLLLLPFLTSIMEASFRFNLGQTSLIVSPNGVAHTATRDALLAQEALCTMSLETAAVANRPKVRVTEEEQPSIAVLQFFAQTRRAGRGAGNAPQPPMPEGDFDQLPEPRRRAG